MTRFEIMEAFDFVEKEDLLVWPDQCIEGIDIANVKKIMAYLEKGPISGEELFVLDLPAFLYPAERFKTLWTQLVKRYGKGLAEDIREEEITPSDEFEAMDKKK